MKFILSVFIFAAVLCTGKGNYFTFNEGKNAEIHYQFVVQGEIHFYILFYPESQEHAIVYNSLARSQQSRWSVTNCTEPDNFKVKLLIENITKIDEGTYICELFRDQQFLANLTQEAIVTVKQQSEINLNGPAVQTTSPISNQNFSSSDNFSAHFSNHTVLPTTSLSPNTYIIMAIVIISLIAIIGYVLAFTHFSRKVRSNKNQEDPRSTEAGEQDNRAVVVEQDNPIAEAGDRDQMLPKERGIQDQKSMSDLKEEEEKEDRARMVPFK